ncbi:heterokaryon incompatibility protein-domain-containing protein [Rhexocercosporidium sp. MPI-PUGE-AT-0058]|nr:heterokaryon incompatibility protein-domain-containing protein [Rhexocercosporidium sp. MPI-PUGE-AT-0058]
MGRHKRRVYNNHGQSGCQKKGIELCSLPATFQDAIKITRAVGRKYIWIDTLCIIQRSEQDWIEESAKMGSYYSSSWLTIGAGVESAQGLFEERRLDIIQYAKVDLHEPENSRLYFTNRPVNRIIGDDQNSILRKRAWTFQEEILSPRYLGFQSNQMYYRCGEYIYFESGCKEWLFPPEGSERYEGEAPLFQDLILEGDWLSDIIVDYSSRELSHGSDKLPAISGIAHERYRLRGGHYVAGLWEEDLPQALCWTKEYATSPCLKPVDYRAPSWSWAAIDGKVAPVRIISSVIEADIVYVSTKPKGADSMGAVSGGVLVVCGVLRPGLLHTKQKWIEGRSITKYDFKLLCSNEYAADDTIYTFVPDTSDYSDIHTTLWFFNITSQLGLALIPVSSSHPQHSKTTFERVGLIQISMQINDDLIIAGSAANLSKEKFRTTITIV